MRYSLLIIFWVCLGFTVKGQVSEFGLAAGVSVYEGDLAPNEIILYFQTLRPAVGVYYRRHLSRHWAVRGDARFLTLFGDDEISSRVRGINFRTHILEATLQGEWSLFTVNFSRSGSVYAQPYAHMGLGVIRFNPQANYQGNWVDLRPLGTEGQGQPGYAAPYGKQALVLPFGGGVKLVLNDRVVLAGEGMFRFTSTDYLDDVGNVAVRYQDVLNNSGPLGGALSNPTFNPDRDDVNRTYQRGGPARDFYFVGELSLGFFFGGGTSGGGAGRGRGKGLPCPRF
ncbi:MAG: hypothetical protein H6555_09895 [Lewinellaceae bacterium]|nr:hypothetical protein [Lewinellaceae bacterium]